MSEPDARLQDVTFSATDFVRLIAATYLPLCDELEARGVLDRARLADAMSLYVAPSEATASAAFVTALQTVLRRPRGGEPKAEGGAREVALRLIPGGLSIDR